MMPWKWIEGLLPPGPDYMPNERELAAGAPCSYDQARAVDLNKRYIEEMAEAAVARTRRERAETCAARAEAIRATVRDREARRQMFAAGRRKVTS